MKERLTIEGLYTFDALHLDTGCHVITTFKNALTQGFFSAIHQFLRYSESLPNSDALDITRLAFGEGTTSASRNDTVLVDEQYRKSVASRTFTNTLFTARATLAAGEWNPTGGYIKEVGIFARATDTPDDGTLLSRAVVNVQKNSNIQLSITWELRMV
jgi:hypothetical protein